MNQLLFCHICRTSQIYVCVCVRERWVPNLAFLQGSPTCPSLLLGCPRGRSAPLPGGPARLSAKLLLQKSKRSQKKAAGKDKYPGKKCANKGERGAKGKQAEVTNQEPEEDLPAENKEIKNEESPASNEAGEKDATSN